MNNDLRRLPVLLRLSGQKRAVINQNFLRRLALVVGGTVLGALRLITPIVAAVFHVTGSRLGVFNNFRLVRHGEELEPYQAAPLAAAAAVGRGERGAPKLSADLRRPMSATTDASLNVASVSH